MRKFLFDILKFFAVLVVLDISLGYLLTTQRPIDYKQFLDAKKEFFDRNEHFDVLIIGDSHVADAVDPRILEKNLSLKSYNLGVYHSSPYENYHVTKAALNRLKKKPNLLILGTNPIMFERPVSKGKYGPLILPYSYQFNLAKNSEEGFDIAFFSKTFREKYLFKSLFNKLKGKKYTPTREVKDVYNGHLKFFNQKADVEWHDFEKPKLDSLYEVQIQYFEKTIELAKEQDIAVLVVHPPIWKENLSVLAKSESYERFSKIIEKLVEKHKLSVYYDYPNDPHFQDTITFEMKDFLNPQHLNYYGSEKFTKELIRFLEKNQ